MNTSKEDLIHLLKESVELEMVLMVQYLYTAYSIPNLVTGKKYVENGLWTADQLVYMCGDGEERLNQGARGIILNIAREEMIHFLLANNLLMSIGEGFHVNSPSYSKLSKLYPIGVEMALEPFSKNSITRFLHLESPHPPTIKADTQGRNYTSVSELYQKIRSSFISKPEFITIKKGEAGGEHHLYLNQKTNDTFPSYECRVDDLQSAIFAIDLITEQGEGMVFDQKSIEESHYSKFKSIKNYMEYNEIPLVYPCLTNPSVSGEIGMKKVTNKYAIEVMLIFNKCFEISMQMMVQHFGLRPKETLRRSYLMNASIDLMTGIMRSLGVYLMTIESGIEDRTAGPSFEISSNIEFIQDHDYALNEMSNDFKDLHRRALELEFFPDSARDLLAYFITYTKTLK